MFLRFLLVLLLTGCSGVQMTEAERIQLIGKVYKDAYYEGWRDSNKQGGRDL